MACVRICAGVLHTKEGDKINTVTYLQTSSCPLLYIISTQSLNQNLHSKQIVKYEWPLYITIDISPVVAFLHDNEDPLHT